MREEEELNRVDKEKEEDSKAGLSVRVDKEKEEDSKAGLSVLKFTPEPLLPELAVGGLRKLFSAPEPLPRNFVRISVHWKESNT